MHYGAINLMAFGGKLAVESTSLNRWQKEGAKFGIDILAEMTKSAQQPTKDNFSVMGLSLSQIQFVKSAAEKHNLDRVTIFPCPVNGVVIPCLKMEGGNVEAFCATIGTPLLQKSSVNADESEQATLIEQFGAILYQRRNAT